MLTAFAPGRTPVLRRACACGGTPGPTGECEACRKKRLGLQRSASAAAPAVAPPVVHDVLRSSGAPLDASVRAEMEPRFRHSFADVRVHADGRAAESARAVGAHAYAVGRNVVFGAGRYAPGSVEGRRLIAHELAHVVQQRGASAASLQPKLEIGAADDLAEREADTAAEAALAGGTARVAPAPAAARLRRVADPGPPPPGLTCTPATSSPGNPIEDLVFPRGVSALDPAQQARVDAFVVSWRAMAGMGDVRVDGYASEEASGEFNWRLSCDRAQAVAARMERPGGGAPGIPAARINRQAHSETTEFSPTRAPNRRVTIFTTAPVPPAAPAPAPAPALVEHACFDGTTLVVTKGGRTDSCTAVTGTAGAPTPHGLYCIRRQGEAQRRGGWRGLFQDRTRWYLIEPQFPTTRSRMQIHPGIMSEGCVTVTDRPCFDRIAAILNLPGTVSGTGFDGYPPGNGDGVTNPPRTITCVGWLRVTSAGGCARPSGTPGGSP